MDSCCCNKRNSGYVASVFYEDTVQNSKENSAFPTNYKYGYTYVPTQKLNKVFTPKVALKKGTLFPELVDEYCPYQSINTIEYLKNSKVERSY